MIRAFGCYETRLLFELQSVKKMPIQIQAIALRKLEMLNYAASLNDLFVPPSNRLEKLKGSRKGSYSRRVNKQWRICFSWHQGDAYEVEIVDYH
ncbi:MAG: type II toxin-antitoxin system RelE/ParE family toxin [Coxiellaceae bacterium]|nr:type II toxin-antitoxin system RelE/ParE family toxin [Coxiellaceae bacterium]